MPTNFLVWEVVEGDNQLTKTNYCLKSCERKIWKLAII